MKQPLARLSRWSGLPLVCAVAVGASCAERDAPELVSAVTAAPVGHVTALDQVPLGQAESSTTPNPRASKHAEPFASLRRLASRVRSVVPAPRPHARAPHVDGAPRIARLAPFEPASPQPHRARPAPAQAGVVLSSNAAAASAAATVQIELPSEAYDGPTPTELPSIAQQWATAEQPVATYPECDGCMRLTTTPRGPRPPVHSYVFTEVAGDTANVRGGYGGHILAERLLLGGGGFGLARHSNLATADGVPAHAQRDSLGTGGFFGAFLPLPNAVVQPIAAVFVGVGNLSYKIDATEPLPAEKVFVLAPQLTLEAETSNLTRLGIGASYRVIEGAPIAKQLSQDVTGPTVFGFVLFGYR